MKIRKKYQGVLPDNKIVNTESNSQTDTYSCDYINNMTFSGDGADELPVGTIVDFNGTEIPEGWSEYKADVEEYSEEEIMVGYWKNKPLYRRIIEIANKPGTEYGETYTYDLTQYGVEKAFIDMTHSLMYFNNNKYALPLARYLTTDNFVSAGLDANKIQVGLGPTFSQSTLTIGFTFVVEYTKTTDQEV